MRVVKMIEWSPERLKSPYELALVLPDGLKGWAHKVGWDFSGLYTSMVNDTRENVVLDARFW